FGCPWRGGVQHGGGMRQSNGGAPPLIWTFLAGHAIGCPPKRGVKPALVSRFRGSQALAVHSGANFGIKGITSKSFDSSVVFGFEVPTRSFLQTRRNFKSTTLGCLQCRP